MKIPSFLRVAILVLPLVLTSCGSHKKVQKPVVMNAETREKVDFISAVQENSQTAKFMTSKVKFSVEVGPQKLTLTGNHSFATDGFRFCGGRSYRNDKRLRADHGPYQQAVSEGSLDVC